MKKKKFIVELEIKTTDSREIEYLRMLISRAVYDACGENNEDPENPIAHLSSVVATSL